MVWARAGLARHVSLLKTPWAGNYPRLGLRQAEVKGITSQVEKVYDLASSLISFSQPPFFINSVCSSMVLKCCPVILWHRISEPEAASKAANVAFAFGLE